MQEFRYNRQTTINAVLIVAHYTKLIYVGTKHTSFGDGYFCLSGLDDANV